MSLTKERYSTEALPRPQDVNIGMRGTGEEEYLEFPSHLQPRVGCVLCVINIHQVGRASQRSRRRRTCSNTSVPSTE